MLKYNLTTDVIYNEKTLEDISIIHIADIHFSVTTKVKDLDKLCNYIKNMNPDYIMITGDLIDVPSITEDDKINELISFLENLGKISKVLISIGNHDVWVDEDFKFFRRIDKIKNINVLDDKLYKDNKICALGLTLPNNYYYNLTRNESAEVFLSYVLDKHNNFDYDTSNKPAILLVHSPIKLTDERVLNLISKFDLVLCGHTHAGMVPRWLNLIFKNNVGIIAPNKRLFPKVAKGRIDKVVDNKKVIIIINGAITKLSHQAGKFFNSLNFLWNSDVNKIIIKKEGEKNE